ncbi:hypothetical protein KCP73_26835 (plasmid) [Salmonella enterica subsp. enterica]|nr:hypothetical protein KCP73_26835 [Salmonella enterica subsp. enterica]
MLTFRRLMGTVVQLRCHNDSSGAVVITTSQCHCDTSQNSCHHSRLRSRRHPDDIGHSNLRAQPPVPGIGHPVSRRRKRCSAPSSATGTDERRSAAQQQFSSARPNPFSRSLCKWMPG